MSRALIRLTPIVAYAGLMTTGLVSVDARAAVPNPTVQSAVQEVLVTARRREESLQDVPIAISAFGGEDLQLRGIERVSDLNAVAPNLSAMGGINTGEGAANFRVRGMPGVAVYVDGVNQATSDGLLTMSVVEVERIEVLRGPQGTLFGNNSLGGAIHYVTRVPGDTFGARFRGTIGSYDRKDFQAAIDLPLSDTFKTKFTAASQQTDGFLPSRFSNAAYGDINDELYRADFLWEPLDRVSVRYNYEVSNIDRSGPARVIGEVESAFTFDVLPGPGVRLVNNYPQGQIYSNIGIPFDNASQTSGYPGGAVGEWETNVAWPGPGMVIDVDRHALDLNWEINDTFQVRSITGYRELFRYTQSDLDGTPQTTILDRETAVRQYTFGQELQLLGSHERVDWVLGAYYEQQYNRARTNSRILSEFTCDMWGADDRAIKRISNEDMAACFNLRARSLGVTSLAATPSSIPTNAQLLPLINRNTNGGLDLSQFAGAATGNTDVMTIQRPESKAVFADVTWRVTDQFTVAAGMRYSEDETDGTSTVGVGPPNSPLKAVLLHHNGQFLDGYLESPLAFRGPLPAPVGASKFDALTKRVNLQYQWTPDIMTYVGYSDGYQPGGVFLLSNAAQVNDYLANIPTALRDVPLSTVRDEQTVKNYEVGLRADWLGGALRTNVTAFYTDWQNIPLTQYVATMWWDTDGVGGADSQLDVTGDGINDPFFFPAPIPTSVKKAEASGVELEAVWRATDNMRFDLNVGYLKTEYKELGPAALGIAPATRKGLPFAAAPEYTANLSGQYEFDLSGGAALTPRIDYTYTDDYTLIETELAQRIQKGFGLLNARLTYDSGANWSVSLQGTNLTNEWYRTSGIFTRGERIEFATIGRPREWGLNFDFRFD